MFIATSIVCLFDAGTSQCDDVYIISIREISDISLGNELKTHKKELLVATCWCFFGGLGKSSNNAQCGEVNS